MLRGRIGLLEEERCESQMLIFWSEPLREPPHTLNVCQIVVNCQLPIVVTTGESQLQQIPQPPHRQGLKNVDRSVLHLCRQHRTQAGKDRSVVCFRIYTTCQPALVPLPDRKPKQMFDKSQSTASYSNPHFAVNSAADWLF